MGDAKRRLAQRDARLAALKEGKDLAAVAPLERDRVELLEENRAAWDVCLYLASQVRSVGMGGVVGFDLGAPLNNAIAMSEYLIETWELPLLKEKIKAFEAYWVERVNRKAK